MASEIRANTLKNRVGLGTISFTDTGPVVSGIVTATSFSGDGSNLTGITGVTINGNVDNRLVTATGTTGTLNGESNLTYNGSLLNLTGDLAISTGNRIYFGNSDVAFIKGEHGGSGYLALGANSEHVRITRTGTVGIGGTTIPGALLDLSSATPGILFSETGVSANNGKWLNLANASELYWQAQTDAHSGGGNLFKMTRSAQQIQSFEAQQSGVSWFTIRNSNKTVGIGTNNPQRILHAFEPASNNLLFLESGNTNCDIIQADPGGSTRIRSTQGNFYLYTNGDANSNSAANADLAFRIDADKDVHIYDDLFIGDLKIYHSGSHAYVNNDTGDLYIQSDGNLKIERKDGGEDYIHCIAGGAVELHHSGNKKFETSSTGCSLFGTLEASDTGYGSGSSNIEIQPYGQRGYINFTGTNTFYFRTGSSYTTRWTIDSNGHFSPGADNTYDFGSTALRWRNIYTADLQLSNKGKSNDVDGTWGNYTIQEGESDLFLINNRNGKKYKFNLTEVS